MSKKHLSFIKDLQYWHLWRNEGCAMSSSTFRRAIFPSSYVAFNVPFMLFSEWWWFSHNKKSLSSPLIKNWGLADRAICQQHACPSGNLDLFFTLILAPLLSRPLNSCLGCQMHVKNSCLLLLALENSAGLERVNSCRFHTGIKLIGCQ